MVSAVIDLDNAVFTISIQNALETIDPPTADLQFGLSFEGFAAEALIN